MTFFIHKNNLNRGNYPIKCKDLPRGKSGNELNLFFEYPKKVSDKDI